MKYLWVVVEGLQKDWRLKESNSDSRGQTPLSNQPKMGLKIFPHLKRTKWSQNRAFGTNSKLNFMSNSPQNAMI